jgi:hypothetical protein
MYSTSAEDGEGLLCICSAATPLASHVGETQAAMASSAWQQPACMCLLSVSSYVFQDLVQQFLSLLKRQVNVVVLLASLHRPAVDYNSHWTCFRHHACLLGCCCSMSSQSSSMGVSRRGIPYHLRQDMLFLSHRTGAVSTVLATAVLRVLLCMLA